MKCLGQLLLFLLPLSSVLADVVQEEETVLGKPSPIQPANRDRETVLLEAGSRLHQEPRAASPILEILEISIELPVLQRRGSWVKVRLGSWNGWVLTSEDPSTGDPALPLSITPDQDRLARARALLGGARGPLPLGPFTLYTDVEDLELLDWLGAVAIDSLRAYRERFGLDPGTENQEVVVLFTDESDYRDFVSAEARIAEVESRGYTTEGLSVLYTGQYSRTSLASVYLHELVHLLNRKVFRSETSPWLEEGMAEDLAFSQVTAKGEIRLGTLAGVARQGLGEGYASSEPRAHVAALAASWVAADRPDLRALVNLQWDEFIHPDQRAIHYAESAMFLRLLLDGGEADLAQRFLEYLDTVSTAELQPTVSLWETLKIPPEELDKKLHRFVLARARAYGLQ